MSPLIPLSIYGSSIGLENDKKPFLLPDQAFSELQNAYVWRDRVKKREGLKLLGRLRRILTTAAIGNISAGGAGTFQFNIIIGLGISATEPNAQIESGLITPITIAIGAPINQSLTDVVGTGQLTVVGAGPITAAMIDYSTGVLTITFSGAAGVSAATITGAYYPGLPVMAIDTLETDNINNERVIFFDTKYAYEFIGGFQEFITGTTWDGTDSDFFWTTNYRATSAAQRLFFVTNFFNSATVPMRYTDATTWTAFTPAVDTVNFLLQARVLIPYYGRLLALNVFEGAVLGAGSNFYNRCRFSQIGDATAADAWRSDLFGKGGFIDAPTDEQIISAQFFKNTLIVFFERSTWELRYVGEYGLPFIWERISSDYGSESTFSGVVFDSGVLAVGQTAVVAATSVNVQRIDEKIPDEVFKIRNVEDGPKRVHGIRDYLRELVFWTFPNEETSETDAKFPNTVLVYNYRNNTFAFFRDSVTTFGTFQLPADSILWSATDIFWDDAVVTWGGVIDNALFPSIVAGNQQGYVHYYGYQTPEDPSLSITGFNITVTPIVLTVPNHNLDSNDLVYLSGATFVDSTTFAPVSTNLNNTIYQVQWLTNDTVALYKYNSTTGTYDNNFSFTPAPATSTYSGNGQLALLPVLNVTTKDFNPFGKDGQQLKLSYVDFLMDQTESASMSVNIFVNSDLTFSANLPIGNAESATFATSPYYLPAADYAWHRFYGTCNGQYIRLQITYDDVLMNDPDTHEQTWVLNAMTLYVRKGGKLPF